MPSKFHRQVAALPFRQDEDGVHLLMVTSRTRNRWILPKGNPIKGLTPSKTAEVEALEEAGVVGRACRKAIGAYAYDHLNDDGSIRPSKVAVYPLLVTNQKDDWKEKDERSVKWVPLKRAAKRADDEELSVLLESLAQYGAKALRRIADDLKKAD